MPCCLSHVTTRERTTVTRALSPLFQVGIMREGVKGCIKDKFHSAFLHIKYIRLPCQISVLTLCQFQKVPLLYQVLDVFPPFLLVLKIVFSQPL